MRLAIGICAALLLGGAIGEAPAQTAPNTSRTPGRAAPPPSPGTAPPLGTYVGTANGACRIWVPGIVTGAVEWTGGCRNGLAEGPGTATWPSAQGAVATTGNFRNGALNGAGSRANADGGRYEGAFTMTMPHGPGVYVAANGQRYEGPFVWGAPNGIGRVTFPNGDRFEGGVVNGMGDGQGIYTWANGDRYEGNQTAGYPDGQGRFVSGNQVFEGTWTRGCYYGAGGTRIAVVRPMAECR
ncbi:MORN repeat-containing protein [Plastoroseomonas arctica]|uniref:MORN repeat-containing protein n=1 Tax=Plastoroseomonas arctica TaxID=1509237 RepID=A0AAF1KL82_9PROT|nr:hypothetical protein [Plastoroseomonas arctica]MBR0657570.1 hypothetical protein [Plastoroseomonas arctica]